MHPTRPSKRGGRRPHPRSPALGLELLEGREVPATLLGLTAAGSLVTFDSATPGTLVGSPVAVTGLAAGETLVGMDYRPADGKLYAVGSTSRVYLVEPTTGAATAVGGAFTPALSGTAFGVDFNPVADRLRVVSDTGQSLRINPATGGVVGNAADGRLKFDPDDPNNQGFYGTNPGDPISPDPQGAAAGYTQTVDPGTGTTVTTLYAIDPAQDILFRVGGPDGTDPGPNTGLSAVVDNLRDAATFAVVDFGPGTAFDIEPASDAAFATSGGTLYSVNITTAAVTSLGTTSGTLVGLAVVPPAAGAGTLQLSATAASFPADRDPIALTVTRTGGASTAVTVDFATVDGTAVGGVDYLPNAGTLTFGVGVLSQQIFLLLPAGAANPSPAKTFTVQLSNATAGATLGTASAVVTVPAVPAPPAPPPPPGVPPPPPPPARYFAAGSNAGQVAVYDSNGGALVRSFAAFEGGYAGPIQVATADVNRDGFDDVVVAPGSGGGPRVQIFDGEALAAGSVVELASFFAFESAFTGGVGVATGDINGDGFPDVVAGAGRGGGPRVVVYSLADGLPAEIASFFAFEQSFSGGVSVAAGELTGDQFDDVAVGALQGGGPRVVVYSLANGPPTEFASFFAFAPTFAGGVNVGVGDINGDGRGDVLVGSGPGGPPTVRGYSGLALPGQTVLFDQSAYETTFDGGVFVGSADVNLDGFVDLITGAGRTGGPRLRVLSGSALLSGTIVPLADLFAFDPNAGGGASVGG